MSSDEDWKNWGEQDPYFGVITHDEYRAQSLSSDTLAKFFVSGELHVLDVFKVIRNYFDPAFSPSTILDFGCGTGRLSLPFAKMAEKVFGLDVSPGMLSEAKKNAELKGVRNCEFIESSGDYLFEQIPECDLVHTYIVLQHIPRSRGENIISNLIEKTARGGVGALHFTIANKKNTIYKIASFLRNRVPLLHMAFNIIQRKRLTEPKMRMTEYDVQRIFSIFCAQGITEYFIRFTDHGGHQGLFVFYRRPHN